MEKSSRVVGAELVTSVILDDGDTFIHSSSNEHASVQHMVKCFGDQSNKELSRSLEIYKFIGKEAARSRLIVQMILQDRARVAKIMRRQQFEHTASL